MDTQCCYGMLHDMTMAIEARSLSIFNMSSSIAIDLNYTGNCCSNFDQEMI